MGVLKASDLRRIADRCRQLLAQRAIKLEVRQQLRLWARELEEMADATEARDAQREHAELDL